MFYDDLYINPEGHLETLGAYWGNTGETRPRVGVESKQYTNTKTNRGALIIMLFFPAITSQHRQLWGQTFTRTNNYRNRETKNIIS